MAPKGPAVGDLAGLGAAPVVLGVARCLGKECSLSSHPLLSPSLTAQQWLPPALSSPVGPCVLPDTGLEGHRLGSTHGVLSGTSCNESDCHP